MNSGFGQRLSVEELKRLNQPPVPSVSATPPDTPTGQNWDDLLAALTALYRLENTNSDRLERLEASVAAQEALLRALGRQVGQLPTQAQLEALARDTALFSGAKLECLLNEAAILAAKRDAQSIESADVQHALDTLLFGMERPGASRLAHEREVTAAHEAGHAILTAVLLPQSEIRKVSIIPTGRGATGYSMAVPQEKLFHEKRELMHHIAVALAGREAEALLLGPERVSTGASNDIEKAALIAQRMVCEWGMLPLSDEVCLFSQQQKDQAAQQWLSQGRLLAAGTLRAHQAAWERLTRLLMERESVDGEEVARCLEA